jgi:TonB family protein
MPSTTSPNKPWYRRLREWISGPPTQASLFHYIRKEEDPGVLPDLWNLLRHPIRTFREDVQAPRTRASLFHYLEKPEEAPPLVWKDVLRDLLTGYRFALFIPSLWSNPRELAEERAELRTRKMEAGAASMVIHALMVSLAVFLALSKLPAQPNPANGPAVFINTPMRLPSLLGDGLSGGGKHERLPASGGRLPEASRIQLMAPDPGIPKPLLPSDSSMELKATVQIPIDFLTDLSLPIGDIASPLGGPPWSGPGSGGGIGNGDGTGVGGGNGPGAGLGENGGSGSGPGGTVGPGGGPGWGSAELKLPEVISKATPHYTEEARRARTEGLVILEVVIRANGTVDGIQVIKGLGYGLDESAITTIANKWRFKPATYRGVPIDFKASIQVTFRLY